MAASWRVTGDQGGQFKWSPAGNPVEGHNIEFVTGNNNAGTVFVPDQHYNPASVKVLIQAEANTVDEIAALHS